MLAHSSSDIRLVHMIFPATKNRIILLVEVTVCYQFYNRRQAEVV